MARPKGLVVKASEEDHPVILCKPFNRSILHHYGISTFALIRLHFIIEWSYNKSIYPDRVSFFLGM